MTHKQMADFVTGLSANVVGRMIEHEIPKFPEEWDGNELRQRLAEAFEDATLGFRKRMPGRYRSYRKTIREEGI